MALKLSDLPPGRIRNEAQLAFERDGQARAHHRREKLLDLPAIPATLTLWLDGQPDGTTHHDKDIVMREGKMQLRRSKALQAVHERYALLIPMNTRAKLAGPIRAYVEARWLRQSIDQSFIWRTVKPDWDNFAKPLIDAIAERGWIVGDQEVADGRVVKVEVKYPEQAGVYVRLETIRSRIAPYTAIPKTRCEFTPCEA